TTESARALHTDPLDLGRPHRGLQGFAHRTTEGDAVRQLLGDALRHKLGVGLGVLDLENVQLHLLTSELLEPATEPIRLRTTSTDHDPRTRRVNVDTNPFAGTFDLHLGNTRTLHAGRQELADLDVLGNVVRILFVGIPAGLPVS